MDEATTRTRRDEYAEATRLALLEAGEAAFAGQGFRAAAVEAISRAARVTRGAFYHHFDDKTALFDAVVVELQRRAVERVARASPKELPVWDKLLIGIDAYLDVCLDPIYARIVVKEAPAILGEARFREIEEAYPLALLAASLGALAKRGEIVTSDLDLLVRMVDAMICELSLVLLDEPDPAERRAAGLRLITTLLEALRRR